jgi:hypothetical protein
VHDEDGGAGNLGELAGHLHRFFRHVIVDGEHYTTDHLLASFSRPRAS